MADNSFKVKQSLNIADGGTGSANGDFTVNANEPEFHNGSAVKKLATESNTITLSNKTLDNTTVVTVLDANLTIQDNVDPTKQAKFQASSITAGQTRTLTIPDASITLMGLDANGNLSANNLIGDYATTATAASSTALLVGSKLVQFFTGSTTQTVTLPVASTLTLGQQFDIYNISSGVVTIQSSGANTLQAMAQNTRLIATCILISGTSTASWTWTYAGLTSTSLTTGVSGILPVANGGTSVSSVTTSPTPSSFAGWDANSNLSANNHIDGYATTATAAATTTLTVASKKQQFFTGSTTQTVTMPVTSTLVLGQQFVIVNNSTGVVTVQSSGANSIRAMAANTKLILTCILVTGTTAASWIANYSVLGSYIPTVQTFLSGSGTYTTPAGVSYLIVEIVGGGGGGRGSGTTTTAGNGSNGVDSTFGSSLLTASAGVGSTGTTGGAGGAVTITAPAYGSSVVGGTGGTGSDIGTITNFIPGGTGGGTGIISGTSGTLNSNAPNATANTGTGGPGGGNGSAVGDRGGGGGGGGGYIKAIIPVPAASYSYAVGGGGGGGTAGTTGFTGGAGGSGKIVVWEY